MWQQRPTEGGLAKRLNLVSGMTFLLNFLSIAQYVLSVNHVNHKNTEVHHTVLFVVKRLSSNLFIYKTALYTRFMNKRIVPFML